MSYVDGVLAVFVVLNIVQVFRLREGRHEVEVARNAARHQRAVDYATLQREQQERARLSKRLAQAETKIRRLEGVLRRKP